MRKLIYYRNRIKIRWKTFYTKRKHSSKVEAQFAVLYDEKNMQHALDNYYKGKMKLCLLAGLVGSVLIGMMAVNMVLTNQIEEDLVIERNEFGDGIKFINTEVEMIVETEDEENLETEIPIEVTERLWTEAETKAGFQKIIDEIDSYILGENEDLENIRKPMNLITSFSEYPFVMEWEVEDYSLIKVDGSLGTREPAEDGELVRLTGMISYQDMVREIQLFIIRKPPILSAEEKLAKDMKKQLGILDEKTATSTYMELPMELNGKAIVWKEKKENMIPLMFLLLLLLIVGIYYGKDKDIENQVKKREEELKEEYSNIVSKLVLLMGAGMTIRGSLMRIGNEYKQQKEQGYNNIAYEEILITCNQIATGISEKDAYYNWGKRCRISVYRKLTMLLMQNLKKGTAGLLDILYQENENALEERKNLARKKGEEAGTKLLLPMVMMLGVVMIMIIVPAYLSFSM